MANGPDSIILHVTSDGLVMMDRGYDTTPVRYVREDVVRPRVRPVEAEDTEPEGEPLPKHNGW